MKKEKPVPRMCVCGLDAAIISTRCGKMVTCPNPIKCPGNLRTTWKKHEDLAIVEWNGLVCTFIREQKMSSRCRKIGGKDG